MCVCTCTCVSCVDKEEEREERVTEKQGGHRRDAQKEKRDEEKEKVGCCARLVGSFLSKGLTSTTLRSPGPPVHTQPGRYPLLPSPLPLSTRRRQRRATPNPSPWPERGKQVENGREGKGRVVRLFFVSHACRGGEGATATWQAMGHAHVGLLAFGWAGRPAAHQSKKQRRPVQPRPSDQGNTPWATCPPFFAYLPVALCVVSYERRPARQQHRKRHTPLGLRTHSHGSRGVG